MKTGSAMAPTLCPPQAPPAPLSHPTTRFSWTPQLVQRLTWEGDLGLVIQPQNRGEGAQPWLWPPPSGDPKVERDSSAKPSWPIFPVHRCSIVVCGIVSFPRSLAQAAALPVTPPLCSCQAPQCPCPHMYRHQAALCICSAQDCAHSRWSISVEWLEYWTEWDLVLRGKEPSGRGLWDPPPSPVGARLWAVDRGWPVPPRCRAGTDMYRPVPLLLALGPSLKWNCLPHTLIHLFALLLICTRLTQCLWRVWAAPCMWIPPPHLAPVALSPLWDPMCPAGALFPGNYVSWASSDTECSLCWKLSLPHTHYGLDYRAIIPLSCCVIHRSQPFSLLMAFEGATLSRAQKVRNTPVPWHQDPSWCCGEARRSPLDSDSQVRGGEGGARVQGAFSPLISWVAGCLGQIP